MNDLLIHNARVRTLEADQPTAEAVLVRDGRIAAIGSNDDLVSAGTGIRKLDAGGRPVLPGFIDSHVHYWRSGLMEQMLDLRPTQSIAEVLDAVRRRAAEVPSGGLLMARGFLDTKMAENRFPTRTELDTVAAEQMVCIRHNNGHGCVINSKALAFLNIPSGTPGVELDPTTGTATGVLREKVRLDSEQRLYSLGAVEMYGRCLGIMSDIAIRAGATTVHCLEGGRMEGDPDVIDFLNHQNELPHNTVLYYHTTDVDKIAGMGLPRIGGCILIDGTPATQTGALFEPYSDKPDSVGPTYWRQEELDEFVWKAHSAGLQIAVHATCERAIDQMLISIEKALARMPRPNHRHRIEHFYFPREEDLARASRLGVCSGVQPYFEEAFRTMYPRRLGPERLKRVHPYRWHLDAGVMIAGGSDSPVTPINPVAGIHAAVNHSRPEQRISAEEALRMFTINAAYLAFEENECGTLKVGKRGDIVVLSDDPLSVDPVTINQIKVEATIVRGQVVYET